MYTKSLIQQIQESRSIISNFKRELIRLSKSYDIINAIFPVSESCLSTKNGYLEMLKEYNSIQEALQDVESLDDCLYIVNPEQVILGKYKNSINECKQEINVLDCSTLLKIR